jgi:oligopeptide/dipeptide ABC transporter ATP-binding protein
VAVMYLGRVVELADRDTLYLSPKHPYTKALLSSAPIPSPRVERKRERIILAGEPPSPANPPPGCTFHTRCPIAKKGLCDVAIPEWRQTAPGQWVACHLATS